MKSSRTSLILAYNERVEVEVGVWEDELVKKHVKAEQEVIFQSRKDKAMLEDQRITARFKVRESYITNTLDYVIWKSRKYKVYSADINVNDHYGIIELGELM